MVGASVARATLVLALLDLSCGRGHYPESYRPQNKQKAFPVLIWIDPDSGLSEEDTLQACEEWMPKGVRCFLVDKRRSFIRVYAENEKKCPKREDGTYTLASAWHGGKIVFNMKCFGAIGSPHRHKFRAVMVHEIGHQLGIWEHVPLDCKKGKPKKHDSGKLVCGVAVMNPIYSSDVYFMTPIDALAFDLRELRFAVIRDTVSDTPQGEPDCVYLAR